MAVKVINLEILGYAPRTVPVTDLILMQIMDLSPDLQHIALNMVSKIIRSINVMENNTPRSRNHLEALGVYTTLTGMLATHYGRSPEFWQLECGIARNETYGNL